MIVKQLYTNCLAEAAYYIESNGEAAIIDPIREIAPYLELLKEQGTKLKYVFETHFHADFVSGHIDLAAKTCAKIIYGPEATTSYEVYNAKDGEVFKLGNVSIKAIHTPGHTLESTCFLLIDENGKEYALFSGDTLFVGDVGRPDLLDGVMTKEALAGMMYDSLNNKIKKLGDDVILYPAHGPGSSCGKNIGKETWSTIGEQKTNNYALQNMTKEEFVNILTQGLTPPPNYFFDDAKINKNGYQSIDNVMFNNVKALSISEFKTAHNNGALLLDTRHQDNFEKGFIKGSINIGLDGTFAIWVGTIIDINTPLILVTDIGNEEESIRRLARVGYENVLGYLDGGIDSWKNVGNPTESINSISPDEFAKQIKSGDKNVLDVRRITEVENGHVKGAINISLSDLNTNLNLLDISEPYYVHCAGGYRSMIASSILKANGFDNVINVHGGWAKMKLTDIPIETGAPSNLVS
jgi:glyoxylase-like metal-dependent hydrolase (beta-lactamase superfamily II)/rhodanese-related sulfurtransferase